MVPLPLVLAPLLTELPLRLPPLLPAWVMLPPLIPMALIGRCGGVCRWRWGCGW